MYCKKRNIKYVYFRGLDMFNRGKKFITSFKKMYKKAHKSLYGQEIDFEGNEQSKNSLHEKEIDFTKINKAKTMILLQL